MIYNKKNVDNLLRKKQRLFEGFLYRKVMSLFQESVQRRQEKSYKVKFAINNII